MRAAACTSMLTFSALFGFVDEQLVYVDLIRAGSRNQGCEGDVDGAGLDSPEVFGVNADGLSRCFLRQAARSS